MGYYRATNLKDMCVLLSPLGIFINYMHTSIDTLQVIMPICSRLPLYLHFFNFFELRNIYPRPHFSHQDAPLLTSDIRISTDHSHMKVTIRKSKTDHFRNSCTITILATHTACPIQAMERFLSRYPYLNGPIFRFLNGSYISRYQLSDCIQAVLPHLNLNTHSFRIGGASAAAAMGISDLII